MTHPRSEIKDAQMGDGMAVQRSVEQWNYLAAAARRVLGGKGLVRRPDGYSVQPDSPLSGEGTVLMYNDTDEDVPAFGVVSFGEPVYDPVPVEGSGASVDNPDLRFTRETALKVTKPTTSDVGRFGIAPEGIKAGGYGYAVVCGDCRCKVWLETEDSATAGRADIKDGSFDGLQATASGSAQILWIGDVDSEYPAFAWAVIRFSEPQRMLVRLTEAAYPYEPCAAVEIVNPRYDGDTEVRDVDVTDDLGLMEGHWLAEIDTDHKTYIPSGTRALCEWAGTYYRVIGYAGAGKAPVIKGTLYADLAYSDTSAQVSIPDGESTKVVTASNDFDDSGSAGYACAVAATADGYVLLRVKTQKVSVVTSVAYDYSLGAWTKTTMDVQVAGTSEEIGPSPYVSCMPAESNDQRDETTTTLEASDSTPTLGDSVTLTATVDRSAGNASPDGQVTFLCDGTVLGYASVGSGQAVLETTALPAGAHYVTAYYGGDSYYDDSYDVAQVTVGRLTPTVVISKSISLGRTTARYKQDSITIAVTSFTPTGYSHTGQFSLYDVTDEEEEQFISANNAGSFTFLATTPGARLYEVRYEGNLNYEEGVSNVVEVQIDKGELTLTVDSKERVYGSTNPSFTYKLTGWLLGDRLGNQNHTGTLLITCSAVEGTDVGDVDIVADPNDFVLDNYMITEFVNGTLTITKAKLYVQAVDAWKYESDAMPSLPAVITGLVADDEMTAQGVTSATRNSPAGEYEIVPQIVNSGGKMGNYDASLTSGTLTVRADA
jgi:hypothetical protein